MTGVDNQAAAASHDEEIGSWFAQMKNFLTASKINVLYAFIPIAIFIGSQRLNGTAAFITAFFALIPLAQALGDLTEDIAKRTNSATAALINVTFGNATELIVSIAALRIGELDIVRYSLIGSIIGNMLLVTGSALMLAGYRYSMLQFNVHATNSFLTMLILSFFCFIVPTAFSTIAEVNTVGKGSTLAVSRQISVIMIVLYSAYLVFQHKTHAYLFDDAPKEDDEEGETATEGAADRGDSDAPAVEMTAVPAPLASTEAATAAVKVEPEADEEEEEEEDDDAPEYSLWFAIFMTAVVAILISVLSDYLVDSIGAVATSLQLSRHFIGLVIIAIVGNVAEHAGALMMAWRGKMDIALSIAFGSSVQIGLFVMPVVCLMGIAFDQPLDLAMSTFVMATLMASVLLTLSVCNLGTATWLGGVQLFAAWLILALAFLNAPD